MTLKGYIVGTKGNTGRGIASIVENADYTITINLTDGTSYTTDPIAGFTEVAFDENYDLVVTKTDGTQITVETDLDSYRSLLEGYKSDAETAESNASGYATSASGSASTATTQATLARSYARGDTSSRTGEATDNADYYRGLSASSASSSASSASNSETQALKSEGYAVGKQNGTDVTSDSVYYHNNAKYYADEASTSATNASASESTATAAAGVLTNCSATATTLAAGSNATASYSNGVFSFGVPKGADGSLASGGNTGYFHVTLFKNGVRHTRLVHRLVAYAFVPNPDNLPIVNHLDENRANNRADNLQWTTQSQNINYGTRTHRMVETKSRPVIATLPDGTEEYYNSGKEADRILGYCHVGDAIRLGVMRKGRTWRYAK